MKIFTQVNRSQGMIRTLVGLKSRITSTKPLLTMLALLMVCLFCVNENAWAGKAWVYAYSSPQNGGYVYVAKSNSAPSKYDLTKDNASESSWGDVTFYLFYKANTGYEFVNWVSTDASHYNNTTSITTTNSTLTSQGQSVVQYAPMIGDRSSYYAAVFKALPTYYFKATATTNSSTYGNAYVTFTSSAANSTTDAEVTTNCYGTHYNTASMTKTAYFRAVPKTGYVFKGWSTTTSEDDIFNTDKSITYNLTSTKTNSASPATIQYYAIFGERFAPQITGTATENKEVGDSYTADFSFVNASLTTPSSSSTADFYYTITHELSTSVNNGTNVISYNPSTGAIQALNAGKATITFKNKPTATHQEAEVSFVINVTKKEPTFSCGTSMNVGQNLSCTYTNTSANIPTANSSDNFYYVFTNNTPSGITTGSDTPDAILTFSGNKVYGKNAGTGTITFYQKETYMYKQKNSGAINITVSKLQNTLSCSWNSWSKDMNVDAQTGVTFSANNAQTPIVVEQTSGDDEGNVIASYSSANNKITSVYNIGTATWSVSQAENYKYVAAETKTLTVNVKKASQPTCYVVDHAEEQSVYSMWGQGDEYCEAIALNGVGESLVSFEAKKDGGTGDVSVVQYSKDNGQNWTTLRSAFGISSDFQEFGPFAFPALANGERITHIRFGVSATTSMISYRYKNIKVSRKKWFKLEDKDGNEISSLEMPTNTLGGNHTTATFKVDYSTCADQIKVVSNHPHITVSPASFTSDGTGIQEITVTYACDDPESIDGVITVYTPYENKTINVHAATEKKSQEIEWSDLFAGETVSLPQTITSNDAASATSKLPVTYTSGNSEIIEVAEDGLSFTVVGTGTTTLTAMQSGNDLWKSTSDTKTINASNKKIQRIKWNQQFTRSLALGQEIPLTATVTVLNIATGVETESVERSAEIVYTCPAGNGVIEILNETNIRVLGYGNTTITASVAGDENYEAASPVTLPVRVREIQTGDCDMPLVLEQNTEIEFFQGNLDAIYGSAIAINHANGIPDKLSFDVRGAAWKLAIEYYKGGIIVQQSTDNQLSWNDLISTAVSPAKGETESSGEIQLNPNATHIRFVRPSGGQGYHYVGNIHITRLPYLRTENTTIDLGNISVGEKRDFTIPVSYCSVRGNVSISKQYSDNGLTIDELIEADCGDMNTYDIQASILPTVVGPWSNMVTVRDLLSNMYLNVTINATIQKGDQVITWNPSQDILATEVPVLNAVASSGLSVSYAVTSGNNTVARMDNNQVVILQPGTFDITASQNGNSNYNAAPQLVKTFTVTAETLTLLEAPTATGLTYGQTLSASTLTGGSVEDSKHNPVAGTFSWQAGNTRPNAGEEQEMAVVFTPSLNPAWYNTLQTNAEITVIKATPAMTANDVVLTYGAAASSVELSTATGSVAGNWTWTDSRANQTDLAVNTYSLDVTFTPDDGDNYNVQNTTVQVTVNPATPDLAWTKAPTECLTTDANVSFAAASEASTGAISYEIVSGTGVSIDANGVLTITEAGTVTIQATIAATQNYESRSITTSLAITLPNVFTNAAGNGKWDDPANWSVEVPQEEAPDVVVSGELVIDGEVTVGDLTIQPIGGVTIVDDGKLTVTGHSNDIPEYGDIHVKDDGALELKSTAVLEVRHFTLDAKLAGLNALDEKESAASGQVTGSDKLDVNGDVYFQMSFDPKGKISFGWYDFVVPFNVKVTDGIFREGDLEHHLVSGVDFLVQEYSEAKNANKQRAWSNFTGTMQPGRVYTITFNYDPNFDQNTFLFKKSDGAPIECAEEFATQYTNGSGSTDDKGWNGLGNGMLRHGYITGTYAKMQVFNHAENKYDLLVGEKTFAVGTSFFVQVDENTPSMMWTTAEASEERPLYAPKREAYETEEFLLSLRKEDKSYISDYICLSASEEATDEYIIGHDLRKMGTVTEAKSAQIWCTKGGKNLCDIEVTLYGTNATTPLSIYAPTAGSYELNVEEAPQNTMLYLTYNGRAIWNLTYSPYVFDLTKGTTEGYGLKMYVMQVATDLEESGFSDQNSVRKVLIDDVIYIVTPEGKMYDITGKSANY